jgi:phage terminase large subunit GpA-like protein
MQLAPRPSKELTTKALALAGRLWAKWQPPEKLRLSDWSEQHIRIPEGQSSRAGTSNKLRNWPYMREILDVMGDDEHEYVSIIKSVRLGYTKGIVFAIAASAATDPCPIILLMPTDEHARGVAVDEIEPVFDASPTIRDLLQKGRNDGRNTILRKSLAGGGSIKILSARAPAKLRRHDCKLLYIDEADAMEITAEGDPILIAERRTFGKAGRKIVLGSTPTEEGISVVERRYEASDQRIYEVPCPDCGEFNEIDWFRDIEWLDGQPETARYRCPNCMAGKPHAELVPERKKVWMCENGRWRALRPEVKGHAGFKINALVSLLPNASWGTLAKEYLDAKRQGPAAMQVFHNTILARAWRMTVHRVDADVLYARAEPIGLATGARREVVIPRDCLLLTVGSDVQDDRIEATLLGWPMAGAPYVLGHLQFDGNTLEPAVWAQFDAWLKTKWKHPKGWQIGIDAVAVDSGGREGRTQVVYNWCEPRLARRIYAIKGIEGPRKLWERAKKVKNNMRLHNVAVDVGKTAIMDAMSRPRHDENGIEDIHAMRFSDQLPFEWFEQCTNEVRKIRYKGNRAEIHFTLKRQGLRNEALDCLNYGWIVRQAPAVRAIDLREREAREPEADDKPKKPRSAGDYAAAFNGE